MIRGYRSLNDIDAIHQDQHRILFQNALGVIEKIATIAPTANTLPVGFVQCALISGIYYLYVNINGTIKKIQLELSPSDIKPEDFIFSDNDLVAYEGDVVYA